MIAILQFFIVVDSVRSTEVADSGFAIFWTEFRQAVIDNDKNKIDALTYFPFEVRGVDDSDAIQSLDEKMFSNIYERLIAQMIHFPIGNQMVAKPMRELIYETSSIFLEDAGNYKSVRFQQFEFERKNGQWRFVRAFLEE
ncbi:hypothetical protein W03_10620 [Nitrosomonas sp. PY1]|uniref:hypothetical protein n=1 Tax=Nitrosomonas sp. PY1 TaxID=1803906 RepID=UPI001FC8C141|nr:hypothetical protein [Nitrosomonas sp. PY1]GKS69058.1 hypothetical protein W03_10620 [Nitrosomonas sp. PY1]